MYNFKHLITLLFFYILCISPSICIEIYGQQEAIFRHFNKKDGLSQSSVFAIAQDESGYMWFGTRDGLNKYDGYRFKVYRNNPSKLTSLVSNDVRSLYYDAFSRSLWVGTLDGLSRYDEAKDAFVNYTNDKGLSSNSIRCILRDSKHRLWVGTANGLNLYDVKKNSFTPVLQNVITYPNQDITSIFEDREGIIWIGTLDGLYKLNQQKEGNFIAQKILYKENANLPLLDDHIKAILEDQYHNLWIGTEEGGVYCWNRKKNHITAYQHDANDIHSLSHNNIRSMALAPDGSLWIGTFVGLNKFLPEKGVFSAIYE